MWRLNILLVGIGVAVVLTACTGSKKENAKEDSVDKERKHNKLIGENSPYLLQHAHNPVDWYPWGEEAFSRAREENKPIFLSIGYSSCHWCHVMERESFENDDIARLLNSKFISIKVDREERPGVDAIYMNAVQMLTGAGGWPLSVFLTPELKPFFGGTYFPPEDMYGRPGFKSLLTRVVDVWEDQQSAVLEDADRLTMRLRQQETPPDGEGAINKSVLKDAVDSLRTRFDPVWGGFGGAPKFPPSAGIGLVLRYFQDTGEPEALEMVTLTLDKMAQGGMYDHLGGGFHRYSVDHKWLVPHFEKMLYDNALLSSIYTDAYLVTRNEQYRRVAMEVMDYVLNEMRDETGGFHSAEDADSEGVEGKYYVWSKNEIEKLLSGDNARLFCDYFGVSEKGNFEERNILNISVASEGFAKQRGLKEGELLRRIDFIRENLLPEREKRIRPGRDDKVLVSWNALMISSLAKGYQVFGETRFLEGANRAADHILTEMMNGDRLHHTFRDGTASVDGYLDDYANLINALVDLYESDFNPERITVAMSLAEQMKDLFWDEESGGFFFTSLNHDNLLVRTKPYYDGSVPSGNSMAAMACLRLGRLTGDRSYEKLAEKTLLAFSTVMNRSPSACQNLISVADAYLSSSIEVVIAGSPTASDTREMLKVVRSMYQPNRLVALLDANSSRRLDTPLFEGRQSVGGAATAYVCENYACRKPVNDLNELATFLRETGLGGRPQVGRGVQNASER